VGGFGGGKVFAGLAMKKTLEWWLGRKYNRTPKISFVMNVHNMVDRPIATIRQLRKFHNAEIIVVDDGSEISCTHALLIELTGINEFLLHANDLFEVLTTNRAFYFAHGEYIAMIQDDDSYNGTNWVSDAIELFSRHNDMAVLGGRMALRFHGNNDVVKPEKLGKCTSFRFVQTVNAAPMWIRRSSFLELGGFDEDFAPFQWSETELCMRAWLNGMSVGWYSPGRVTMSNTSDRRENKNSLVGDMIEINRRLIYRKFCSRFQEIDALVGARNCNL